MKYDYSRAPAELGGRRTRRIALTTALCVVGAASLMSHETIAKREPLVETGLMPTAALQNMAQYEQALQAAVSDSLEVPEASNWVTVPIRQGQTLSTIFTQQDLPAEDWINLLKLGGDCLQLQRLQIGHELLLRKSGDRLAELSYALDELRTLNVRRTANGFEADTFTAELEHRQRQTAGVINNSLFVDGQKAGMSDRMIMEMAQLFGYDIDFALDLQRGDRFSLVYEDLYKGGVKLRDGDILAAEFVNRGKVYRAVRHIDSEGHAAYYTPKGESLKKAFIRTPLDFARISSPFNPKRRHPILNTIRAHKGVDYAARSGTPIKAVGDGKVVSVGVKGGYGRTVVLQHGQQYQTLYAHMSRFRPGLHAGSRVEQGQIIGYVGASGLATAPHLHYEFRINGVHVNPVTVPLPRANPIDASQLAEFKAQTLPLVAQLDTLSVTQLAQADAAPPVLAATH